MPAFPSPRRPLPLLLLALVFLAACSDDDPVSPDPASPWREVALALPEGDARVVAVDFAGAHGSALGLVVKPAGDVVHSLHVWQPGGAWVTTAPPATREDAVFLDLAIDDAMGLVMAGFQTSGPPSLVADLRPFAGIYVERNEFGMLTVDAAGEFVVAEGRASGDGGLWTSLAPGDWTFEALPLSGTNDTGFRDVDITGGRAVACGYDDGADTLQVLLTRTATTDWEPVKPVPAGTRTYFCVAQGATGTIWVGGIEGAGGVAPRAFLVQRNTDGSWTELILPDPEGLHGVMDILVTDDAVYLACMGEGDATSANLVRADDEGVRKEFDPFPGGLLQLGRAPDGRVHAVGFRRDAATGAETGVMLVRAP